MASLTIRKLDEHVKTYLRLRSAKNRRSVEEEVRVILGELIEGREEPLTPFTAPPAAITGVLALGCRVPPIDAEPLMGGATS